MLGYVRLDSIEKRHAISHALPSRKATHYEEVLMTQLPTMISTGNVSGSGKVEQVTPAGKR